MPNKANAWKALRQSEKRAEKNLMIKSDIKTKIKKIRQGIEAGASDVEAQLKELQELLDKAVKKNIFKENNAARKLSRLWTRYHKKAKGEDKK